MKRGIILIALLTVVCSVTLFAQRLERLGSVLDRSVNAQPNTLISEERIEDMAILLTEEFISKNYNNYRIDNVERLTDTEFDVYWQRASDYFFRTPSSNSLGDLFIWVSSYSHERSPIIYVFVFYIKERRGGYITIQPDLEFKIRRQ